MKIKSKNLKSLLDNSKNLAIVMHQNPDGDAMGSALALYCYAKNNNINATVISPTNINENLMWMPYSKHILQFQEDDISQIKKLNDFDSVAFVDHSSEGRNGEVSNYLNIPTDRKAFIDHHPSPNIDVGIAISQVDSAATCCVLYEVFDCLNITIDIEMATCLYTGIVTDTGNFKYGKGIAQVFRIASKLIELGVNKEKVTERIYNNNSVARMKLLGFALLNRMNKVGANAAYIALTEDDIYSLHAEYNDTEDFVNQPLTMKDVHISGIFIEKDDFIKISLRSRGEFDVNLLARKHFNGGGHKNAAGGRYYGTLEEAVDIYTKNII